MCPSTLEDFTVYMEASPNPDSLKFVASRLLVPEGMSFDFPDADSAAHAPLARELFTYPFVKRVFYMHNFITVTKQATPEWASVQHVLRQHIQNFIAGGQALIEGSFSSKKPAVQDGTVAQKIKELLDEYVQPAVAQDGGAITFHSYVDGVLTVRLQGACRGCPAANVTLKTGIEALLKKTLPGLVKKVEALNP